MGHAACVTDGVTDGRRIERARFGDVTHKENVVYAGAYRETQKGGETEGEGRILSKIYSFCEILKKMSQKGEGQRTDTPLCAYVEVGKR